MPVLEVAPLARVVLLREPFLGGTVSTSVEAVPAQARGEESTRFLGSAVTTSGVVRGMDSARTTGEMWRSPIPMRAALLLPHPVTRDVKRLIGLCTGAH